MERHATPVIFHSFNITDVPTDTASVLSSQKRACHQVNGVDAVSLTCGGRSGTLTDSRVIEKFNGHNGVFRCWPRCHDTDHRTTVVLEDIIAVLLQEEFKQDYRREEYSTDEHTEQRPHNEYR